MKKPKTWLQTQTGKTDRWWLKRVGDLIAANSNHVTRVSDVAAWSKLLVEEVVERTEVPPGSDGNMLHASVLGYLLTKWFVRLVRAKSYDPRRPVKVRRLMMRRLAGYCQEVTGFMVDESEDCVHFPKQKWDPPFAPGAKDGRFR